MRVLVAMFVRNRTAIGVVAGVIACLGAAGAASSKGDRAEWRHYLGGQDSASYSALDGTPVVDVKPVLVDCADA